MMKANQQGEQGEDPADFLTLDGGTLQLVDRQAASTAVAPPRH